LRSSVKSRSLCNAKPRQRSLGTWQEEGTDVEETLVLEGGSVLVDPLLVEDGVLSVPYLFEVAEDQRRARRSGEVTKRREERMDCSLCKFEERVGRASGENGNHQGAECGHSGRL